MTTSANARGNQGKSRPGVFAEPDDIKLDELLRFLGGYADHPLVFSYDGCPIDRGYHATEVKVGRFDAFDCGANPECWTEIFVHLWDVDEGERVVLFGDPAKGYTTRRIKTVFGAVKVRNPRWVLCRQCYPCIVDACGTATSTA
jgi:hypothetical protein